MGLLDAVKVNNIMNEYNSDYKPELKSFIQQVPELKFADIFEWDYFDNDIKSRNYVEVSENAPQDYAFKLEYLINNNILTRTDRFYWDQLKSEATSVQDAKYSDFSERVRKTDFLSNLLKSSEKPITSRVILAQTPYRRIDENFNETIVQREPIETSPYQRFMGELGLDSNQSDIVVNHQTFRQIDVMATNDVPELYLDKALSKNIVKPEEIGGKEGESYLSVRNDAVVVPSWRNLNQPIRQGYNPLKLSEKIMEQKYADQYPERYAEFKEVLKTLIDLEEDSLSNVVTTMPWGDSFKYNVGDGCAFSNPFNKTPMVIEKKDNKEGGTQYQYFKKEDMTLLDAYVMTYKALKASTETKKLSQQEVEFINSAYNLNLGSMLADEKEAVEYLIAVGIVDGNDENLYRASSQPLTNELMVSLLYNINNSESRMEFKPNLTDIDKEMLKKGYSQSKVSFSETNIDSKIRVMSGVGGLTQEQFAPVLMDDIVNNPASYEQIFVRVPKELAQGSTLNYKMVVDDEYRTTINPSETRVIDGYTWVKYIVHRDSSTLALIANAEKLYSLKGINGEGAYIIQDGISTGNFIKIQLTDSKNNKFTKEVYKDFILESIENFKKINAQAKIDNNIVDGEGLKFNKSFSSIIKEFPKYLSYKVMAVIAPKSNLVVSYQDNEKPVIVRGPYKASALEFYKYKGDYLFSNTSGKWEINQTHTGLEKNESSRIELKGPINGDNYYIFYTPKTSAYQIEMAKYIANESIAAGSTDSLTIPGYAKTVVDGKSLVLIGENELKNFGIEKLSDKVLMNSTTGQRAFINTDDNYTLIGNNISHYPKDTLFVTVMGDKVFYNLDTIIELINDTNTVKQFAGSEIYVGKGTETFKITDVKDVELNTVVDKTYLYKNSETSDTFMNLSALTGFTSNFIYFKTRTGDKINALIVYKPRVGEVVSSRSDNSLVNFMKDKKVATTGDLNPELRKIIMDKLFKIKDTSIITGTYNFDIYLLTNNTGSDTPATSITNFLSYLSDGDAQKLETLKKAKFDSVFGMTSGTDSSVSFKNINVNDNLNNDFLIHGDSHNLYFRIRKGQADMSAIGRKIFYQNFYLSNTDLSKGEILFRRYHFFENTGDEKIPLEIYGKNTTGIGALENKKLVNFGNNKYKLTFATRDNTNLIEFGKDAGIFTRLELPFVKLDNTEVNKLSSNSELDSYLYKLTLEEFKKVAPDYDLEKALTKTTLGWKNTLDGGQKRQFFSSSWEGIVSPDATYNLTNQNLSGSNVKILSTGHLQGAAQYLKNGYSKSAYYLSTIDSSTKTFSGYTKMDKPNLTGDVYYKPNIMIPAGTTLVTIDGKLEYKPSESPRSEIYYISDIINTLVSRIKDKPKTYLFEIPKGSVVHLTEGKTFIKLTPEQTKESGSLKWVDALGVSQGATYKKGGVTDLILYQDFINNWANLQIPYNYGKIYLKDILGKGMFRLPTLNDVNSAVNNPEAVQVLLNKGNIWGRVGGSDNDYTLAAIGEHATKPKTFQIYTRTDKAQLSAVLLLPPSIEVEPHPTLKGVYTVKAYSDISKFIVDKDNSATNYLISKDTPAESVLGILDSLRMNGMKGTKYLAYSEGKFVQSAWDAFITFATRIVPGLLIAFWSILTFIFVLIQFEVTRTLFEEISEKIGFDMLSKMTLGYMNLKEPPSLQRYVIVSFILMFIVILLYEGLIFKIIANIFNLVFTGFRRVSEGVTFSDY